MIVGDSNFAIFLHVSKSHVTATTEFDGFDPLLLVVLRPYNKFIVPWQYEPVGLRRIEDGVVDRQTVQCVSEVSHG